MIENADSDVGKRLEQVRDEKGLTQAQIADILNIDQSTWSKWVSGERGLGAKPAKRIEEKLGAPADWLLYGGDRPAPTAQADPPIPNELGAPGPDASDRFRLPKDIKVLGTAECGPNGRFIMDHGDAIDWVRRPPGIASAKDVFCIHLQGDSMQPYFRAGELIYLSEKRPVQVGGLVVVEMHAKNEGEPGPSLFKALVRKTAEYVELQQANPDRKFKIPMKDVKKIYRVLTNAELWGV